MADVKGAVSGASSFTITNANLTSSATAGWMSAVVDNTSNKYIDAIVQVYLAAVNTAPANHKQIFMYAWAEADGSGTSYTSTGDGTPSGSEGTLTFPDITTSGIVMPKLGIIQYPVQNKAINSQPFSVAEALGLRFLPPKWGIAMLNYSGMTLNVTAIKWNGVYGTVA